MKTLSLLLSIALLLTSAPIEAKTKDRKKGKSTDGFQVHQSLVSAGEALQDGQSAEAEVKLQELSVTPVWDFWKSALLARARLNQGNAKGALELLEKLPPPPADAINRNETHYRKLYHDALETGRAATVQQSKAEDEWSRKLWVYFPDFEEPIASIPAGGMRAEDKIARLHILFDESLFESIPALISPDEIAGSSVSSEDKCRAFLELGLSFQKLRRKDEALEPLGRVGGSCDEKTLSRALYWKGTIESDLKLYDAAETTFTQLGKKSGEGRYNDDAYYRLYKMYRTPDNRKDGPNAGDASDKAERALKNLLELPQGDMKERYLWDEAFAAYQNKDYAKSLEFLERTIHMRSIGTEAQPQALYWKARITEIQSRKKLGGSSGGLYHQILKTYPFSFYAMMAEARLGDSASVPSVTKPKNALPADPDLAGAIEVVGELNRKNDHRSARDLLDYLTHLHPDLSSGFFKEKPEGLAQLWMDSRDYNRTLELATEQLDKSVFDINLEKDNPLTRALYPLAYPEEVKQAAEINRLPAALILGIMREESLFQEQVRSHAGAIGLMQLMPATARIKAKGLGIVHSTGDLKNPASNIVLGASFLRDMMNRFSDQTALAVMAYNAGPGNVSKWMRLQGYLPMDEFIEAIPFTETRGYVKRVLRSAHIYGHLTGKPKQTRAFKSLEPPH